MDDEYLKHDDCIICDEGKSILPHSVVKKGGVMDEWRCTFHRKKVDRCGICADEELASLRTEVERLREAVEWACENAPAGENAYVGAIRRKAKEG